MRHHTETREARLKRMREYTKVWQAAHGGKSSYVESHVNRLTPVVGTRPLCSTFACGRTLSLIESLAGGKCTGCMDPAVADLAKHISH